MSGKAVRFRIYALDKTARAFQSVRGRLSGLQKKIRSVKMAAGGLGKAFSPLGGIIAAAFSGIAFKAIADFGDRLDKLGLRLGTTADFLSEMKFVSEQTGVSFDTFGMAMQRANRRIAEAAKGSGEAKGALKELGLNAQELNNLTLEQKFMKITDALDGVGNQSDKTRLAMKLFDSEGVALIQTMEGGSDAVNKLREDARFLGATMTDVQADAMAKMNDSFHRLGTAARGVAQDFIAKLAPALSSTVNWLADAVAGMRIFAGVLVQGFRIVVAEVIKFGNSFIAVFRAVTAGFKAFAGEISQRFSALGDDIAAFLADPLGGFSFENTRRALSTGLGEAFSGAFNDVIADAGRFNQAIDAELKESVSAALGLGKATETQAKHTAKATKVNNDYAGSLKNISRAASGGGSSVPASVGLPFPVLKPDNAVSAGGFKPVPDFLKEEAAREGLEIRTIFADSLKDSLRDFESFKDSASGLLSGIGERLMNRGIDTMFGVGDNAGGGSIIGGIFNGIKGLFGGSSGGVNGNGDTAGMFKGDGGDGTPLDLSKRFTGSGGEGTPFELDSLFNGGSAFAQSLSALMPQFSAGIEIVRAMADTVKMMLEGFAKVIGAIFKGSVTLVAAMFKGTADILAVFFQGVTEVMKIVFKIAAANALGRAIGGGDTIVNNYDSGQSVPSGQFGGFFAEGGNPPVGKASMVGERGPELIVPRRPMTVIPNHELGNRQQSGGNIYVNMNISTPDVNSFRQYDGQLAKDTARKIEAARQRMS